MTMTRRWQHTLQLADVFHNEALPDTERIAEIVRRIKADPFIQAHTDDALTEVLDNLAAAENVAEFDVWWDEFYDWADDERVWVATF